MPPPSITTTFEDVDNFILKESLPWPSVVSPAAPAPSPAQLSLGRRSTVLFPVIPFVDSAFDLAVISLILCLLILSLLSVAFILHLRLKSRLARQLQNFTSHSTLRLLLISFVSLWSFSELLRLPFLRRRYLFPFPFLPTIPLPLQAQLCKLHIILSLGLLQPGFLITLLFLVNLSIRSNRTNDGNFSSSLLFTAASVCFPLSLLLYLSVYQFPHNLPLPDLFHRSSAALIDDPAHMVVICTCPLTSAIIFSAFAAMYGAAFLFSSCRVVSMAINKRLRARINALAATVVICLSVQVALVMLSVFWSPEDMLYYVIALVAFFSVAVCAAVGEGVLVIGPIADALSVIGSCGPWDPGFGREAAAAGQSRSGRQRIEI